MLQIELTEGAMFEQVESPHGARPATRDAINDLRALGVRIAIDDFGTGYSSLSYLKRWRVDYLKIDRSFIRDLVTDSNDHAIVGAIIAMAQHLQIKVIAEGVEGWSQLEMLRELGCRYAQGYLFAEPAPANKCREFLNGRPLGLNDVRHRPAEGRQRLIASSARSGHGEGGIAPGTQRFAATGRTGREPARHERHRSVAESAGVGLHRQTVSGSRSHLGGAGRGHRHRRELLVSRAPSIARQQLEKSAPGPTGPVRLEPVPTVKSLHPHGPCELFCCSHYY